MEVNVKKKNTKREDSVCVKCLWKMGELMGELMGRQ